jgi:hypothetical protein
MYLVGWLIQNIARAEVGEACGAGDAVDSFDLGNAGGASPVRVQVAAKGVLASGRVAKIEDRDAPR